MVSRSSTSLAFEVSRLCSAIELSVAVSPEVPPRLAACTPTVRWMSANTVSVSYRFGSSPATGMAISLSTQVFARGERVELDTSKRTDAESQFFLVVLLERPGETPTAAARPACARACPAGSELYSVCMWRAFQTSDGGKIDTEPSRSRFDLVEDEREQTVQKRSIFTSGSWGGTMKSG
jgi:hypothetical protein